MSNTSRGVLQKSCAVAAAEWVSRKYWLKRSDYKCMLHFSDFSSRKYLKTILNSSYISIMHKKNPPKYIVYICSKT